MSISILTNLATGELVYLAIVFFAALLYAHFFLNYSWNIKQLSLLEPSKNLSLIPFSFWGAMVCIFTMFCLLGSGNETLFTTSMVVLLLSVVWARYYYFKSLSTLFNSKRIERPYFYLVCFYTCITLWFCYVALTEGYVSIFDLDSPTNTPSALRNALMPYELKKSVKLLFVPNYLFCQFSFFYFAYRSYKSSEWFLLFGVSFTIAAIFYTNSYHLLDLKYWIPLNVVADVFELIRLNLKQKSYIKGNIDELNLSKLDHNTLKHDLANNLTVSQLNLMVAKRLLKKTENVDEKIHEKLDKTLGNALNANEFAGMLLRNDERVKPINLEETLGKLSNLVGIPISLVGDSEKEIHFCEKDLNNILMNLVKNAKEANSSQEKPWINVGVKKEKNRYHFHVQDSGLYSAIENPEKMFQANISSKAKEGRGLGLHSTKVIVEKYGGKIRVESLNQNTCLRFDLGVPQ